MSSKKKLPFLLTSDKCGMFYCQTNMLERRNLTIMCEIRCYRSRDVGMASPGKCLGLLQGEGTEDGPRFCLR